MQMTSFRALLLKARASAIADYSDFEAMANKFSVPEATEMKFEHLRTCTHAHHIRLLN